MSLQIVDVEIASDHLTERDGFDPNGNPRKVTGQAKLVPRVAAHHQHHSSKLGGYVDDVVVEAELAAEVDDGELIALADRYGTPKLALLVARREERTDGLVTLQCRSAPDPYGLDREMREGFERARAHQDADRVRQNEAQHRRALREMRVERVLERVKSALLGLTDEDLERVADAPETLDDTARERLLIELLGEDDTAKAA